MITKRRFFCFFICGLMSAPIPNIVLAQPYDREFYYLRAQQYISQANFTSALDIYNQLLDNFPADVRALNGRGQVLERRGEPGLALEDYEKALELNPNYAEAQHNRDALLQRYNYERPPSTVFLPQGPTSANSRTAMPSRRITTQPGQIWPSMNTLPPEQTRILITTPENTETDPAASAQAQNEAGALVVAAAAAPAAATAAVPAQNEAPAQAAKTAAAKPQPAAVKAQPAAPVRPARFPDGSASEASSFERGSQTSKSVNFPKSAEDPRNDNQYSRLQTDNANLLPLESGQIIIPDEYGIDVRYGDVSPAAQNTAVFEAPPAGPSSAPRAAPPPPQNGNGKKGSVGFAAATSTPMPSAFASGSAATTSSAFANGSGYGQGSASATATATAAAAAAATSVTPLYITPAAPPADTNGAAAANTSTQAAANTNTQAAANTNTQAAASTSTQAAANTNTQAANGNAMLSGYGVAVDTRYANGANGLPVNGAPASGNYGAAAAGNYGAPAAGNYGANAAGNYGAPAANGGYGTAGGYSITSGGGYAIPAGTYNSPAAGAYNNPAAGMVPAGTVAGAYGAAAANNCYATPPPAANYGAPVPAGTAAANYGAPAAAGAAAYRGGSMAVTVTGKNTGNASVRLGMMLTTQMTQDNKVDSASQRYNKNGIAQFSAGNYEQAMNEFNQAIAKSPDFPIVYNNRGVVYAQMGKINLALDDFNHALRLNPFYFDAQHNREVMRPLFK